MSFYATTGREADTGTPTVLVFSHRNDRERRVSVNGTRNACPSGRARDIMTAWIKANVFGCWVVTVRLDTGRESNYIASGLEHGQSDHE
jgi:hypothetical protein